MFKPTRIILFPLLIRGIWVLRSPPGPTIWTFSISYKVSTNFFDSDWPTCTFMNGAWAWNSVEVI
ncbi:hypothetical protein M758_N019100 [Ceratodon purpureus]|nr:hypothetical protein M758_N019100 [Ceratodon purpureus]